ncbi:MAG: glycosyltransferase family 39 protein [Anaerolineae bacterium]
MTDTARPAFLPPLPYPWLESPLWLAAAAALVVFGALVLGLGHPFYYYLDYETVLLAGQARHFAEIGPVALAFQNVTRILADGTIEWYSRRPPGVPLLMSIVYQIAGATVLSTRLFALAEALTLLAATYLFTRQVFGARVAAITALIFAGWPGLLANIARFTFYETLAAAAAVFAAWLYIRWFQQRTPGRFALLAAVTLTGCWLSWEFYFMLPVLGLHWLIFAGADRWRQLGWMVGLAALPVLTLGVMFALAGQVRSSTLTEGFTDRIVGEQSLLADYVLLARVYLTQSVIHFGPPAGILALIALGMAGRAIWQHRAFPPQAFWMVGLGAFGLLFFVVVRNILPGHDFLMVLVMPWMALLAALGIGWVAHWARSALVPALGIAAMVGWSVGAAAYLAHPDFAIEGHMASLNDNITDVLFLSEHLDTGEAALAAFRTSRYPDFYLSPVDRYAAVCITDLAAFRAEMARSARYAYFVALRAELDPDWQPEAPRAAQVYPCEPLDPALLAYLAEAGYPVTLSGDYWIV